MSESVTSHVQDGASYVRKSSTALNSFNSYQHSRRKSVARRTFDQSICFVDINDANTQKL